jgi:putative flippase GtrA
LRERARQLGRFCVVGAFCFALGIAVLAVLHEQARVDYLLAFVAAFVVSNVAGFLLNARFTFAVGADRAGAVRYMMVNAALLGVNTVAMKLLVGELQVWYIAAAVMLAAANVPASFLAQRLITYRLEIRSRASSR